MSYDDNNNNNNPLLKVVFVQRILRFAQHSLLSSANSDVATPHLFIQKFLRMRTVHSAWHESIEFYLKHYDSDSLVHPDIIFALCENLKDAVWEKHPKSPDFVKNVARVVLLCIAKFVRDPKTVEKFCWCIECVIRDNLIINQQILSTGSGGEEIRDAFVTLSFYATSSSDAVRELCKSIQLLTLNNISSQREFCTEEICQSFVNSISSINNNAKYLSASSSSMACLHWLWALSNLTENLQENQQLFSSREEIINGVFSTFKFVSKVEEGEIIRRWLSLVDHLTRNNNNNGDDDNNDNNSSSSNGKSNNKGRQLFATETFRKMLFEVSKKLCKYYHVYSFMSIIVSLSEFNPKLFYGVSEFPKILASAVNGNSSEWFSHSVESVFFSVKAIRTMMNIDDDGDNDDKNLFRTSPEIRQVVSDLRCLLDDDPDRLHEFVYAQEAIARAWKKQEVDNSSGAKRFDQAQVRIINREYLEKAKVLISEIEKMFV